MRRSYVVSLLAYLVPTFLLGYVWHLVLFADYYRDLAIYREHVIVPFGFLSMLLQGAILAAVFPRVVSEPRRVTSAFGFSAGAALLSWTFTTLAVAAKHPMTSIRDFVVIETAFTIVQYLLVGGALVLATRVPAAEAARGTHPA